MSWLDNLKIVVKVGLIVALLGVVMIGETLFAASRMRAMDDANTDIVTRVDKYTTLATRASRFAEAYISGAFQLAVETTDEGNAKYLAQTKDSKKTYQTRMAEVVKHLPEEASAINPVLAGFEKAFVVCDPAIEYAATTSTPEENMKAAARLKAECVPLVEAALGAQTKLVDDLLAHSQKRSDAMTAEANSSIRVVMISAGVGLLLSLLAAMWIGIKGMSQPIVRLKAVMEILARNDFSADVPGKQRRDEIGEMARSVEVFKANGLEVERLKGEQQATERQAAERRKSDMMKLAAGFEAAVGEIVETVSSASDRAGSLGQDADRDGGAFAGTGNRGGGCFRGSFDQRAVRVVRDRRTVFFGQRDQPSGAGIGADGRRGRRPGPYTPTIGSANCRRRQAASATSSNSSTPSQARPICWRSTPPSRRRAPVRPAAALRSWRPR